MSYVRTANPGGKLPGQGWPRGLRGYVRTAIPGGKLPGQGWPAGLRGVRKPIFGCAGGCSGSCGGCKKLGRLGQDDSLDLSQFGVPSTFDLPTLSTNADYPASPESGLTYIPSDTTPAVPEGYGYGPSESGGVAIYPAGAVTPSTYASGSSYTGSTPASLFTLTPTGNLAIAPASSSSEIYWILGGIGLIALLAATKK